MSNEAPAYFSIQDVPEFQRFRVANPQNPTLDSRQAIIMYGRAIHWASILEILWPDFETLDYYHIELASIVANDPDAGALPPAFFQYMADMLAMFWKIQLRQRYPTGDWSVTQVDDPELTVEADIRSRA